MKDREIRRDFRWTSEGAPSPSQHTTPRFVKYTGTLAAPEWEDDEPGRVFCFPWYLVKGAQSQTDKFETLCHVDADISNASCTSKVTESGKESYERRFDIILLVGLTQLKTQVSWIDSETVRAHPVLYAPIYLIRFGYGSRERRKGL